MTKEQEEQLRFENGFLKLDIKEHHKKILELKKEIRELKIEIIKLKK